MKILTRQAFRPSGFATGLALVFGCVPAHANIMFYNLFKVEAYNQTGNSQPTTAAQYAGFFNINASLSGDLSGGNVTFSSPISPATLSGSNGNYAFGDGTGTKAVLDADFPNGATYTFSITGGTYNGQTATLAAPAADAYDAAVPFFTNNAFTALQGVNAANAINLTFNPYTAPGNVNLPLTFIEITQVSNSATVFSTSGDNTLSSATVAANTLLPGTQYDASIVYSDRLSTSNAGFGGATSFTAYDLRTDLIFTTAVPTSVPEPSALLLSGLGMAFLVGAGRRIGARNRNA